MSERDEGRETRDEWKIQMTANHTSKIKNLK